MNWITYTVLGAGGIGAIVFAFMAVRWRAQAAQNAAVEAAVTTWIEHSKSLQAVAAEKERTIVEVEKAVVAGKSGADLASALNRLRASRAARDTAPGTPASKARRT